MVCTIFKSAGIHVIGLTLFYLTIVCKYGATEPLHLFKQQVNKYQYNVSQIPVKQVPVLVSDQNVL